MGAYQLRSTTSRTLVRGSNERNKQVTKAFIESTPFQLREMKKSPFVGSPIMSNVKEFDNEKKLGEGGFGVVFQDVWRGIPVAVKRIKLNDIESNGREEDALDKLDHPNVVKLFHIESDSKHK